MNTLEHQPSNTVSAGLWRRANGSGIHLGINVAENYDLTGKVVTFSARSEGPGDAVVFTASTTGDYLTVTDQRVDIAIPPDAVSEGDGETELSDLANLQRTEWAIDFAAEADGETEYRIQGDIEWIPTKGAFS